MGLNTTNTSGEHFPKLFPMQQVFAGLNLTPEQERNLFQGMLLHLGATPSPGLPQYDARPDPATPSPGASHLTVHQDLP